MDDHDTSGHRERRFGTLLTIAYDGRTFAGFARQPRARTIAGELDGAVRAIDPHASPVRGASRTDAGVHALGQVVAFDTNKEIEPRGWALALASHLPREIGVMRVARIESGFVPRHRARFKTYRYVMLRSLVRDPFWEGRAWKVADRLNQQVMADEAQQLVGQHDFRAFRAAADERSDTVRRMLRVQVRTQRGDQRCLELVVEGDRFMYRMMRIIAGTLVDVAAGRLQRGAISRAISSGTRADLGVTAPPDGLYLECVELDDSGRDCWPPADRNIDGSAIVA